MLKDEGMLQHDTSLCRYKILIVEDDPTVAQLLQRELERFGFLVTVANNLRDVVGEVEQCHPDLILLDVNLPYYDGFYWCRQIRRCSVMAPIIFVSARDGDMDQVFALENGGDDYITKPFHPDLLLAKVRAHLRRAYGEYAHDATSGPALQETLEVHGLRVHIGKSTLAYGDREEPLTTTEMQLLIQLCKARGQIVPREALLETLWDDVEFVNDNTLTVYVTRLRRKLTTLGLEDVVLTVRGTGYRLDEDALERRQYNEPGGEGTLRA